MNLNVPFRSLLGSCFSRRTSATDHSLEDDSPEDYTSEEYSSDASLLEDTRKVRNDIFNKWVVEARKEIAVKTPLCSGGDLLMEVLSHFHFDMLPIKFCTVKELKEATDNYASSNRLFSLGKSTHYFFKGSFEGQTVIIKIKNPRRRYNLSFIDEILIHSQIHHKNIVNFLGCCLETPTPCLVLEYVPNGSLYEHLHYNDKYPNLSWKIRLRIALQIASALVYLHTSKSGIILFGNFSSRTICLDDNFTAKLWDFSFLGFSKTDRCEMLVNFDVGYHDVVQFGFILFELLMGDTFDSAHFKEGHLFDRFDPMLMKEAKMEELQALANLAWNCRKKCDIVLTAMKEVFFELQRIIKLGE
nr:ZRK [Ceratophyllum demersum]